MTPRGIMVHHVHADDGRLATRGSVSVSELRRVIEEHKPVDALEWLAEPNGTVLTFDDGLRCHEELVLTLLDEMGVRAVFGVVTGPWRGEEHRAYIDAVGFEAFFSDYASAVTLQAPPPEFLFDCPHYTPAEIVYRWHRDRRPVEHDGVLARLMSGWDPPLGVCGRSSWTFMKTAARAGHVIAAHGHHHRRWWPSSEVEIRDLETSIRLVEAYGDDAPLIWPFGERSAKAAEWFLGDRHTFAASMHVEGEDHPRVDVADLVSGRSADGVFPGGICRA